MRHWHRPWPLTRGGVGCGGPSNEAAPGSVRLPPGVVRHVTPGNLWYYTSGAQTLTSDPMSCAGGQPTSSPQPIVKTARSQCQPLVKSHGLLTLGLSNIHFYTSYILTYTITSSFSWEFCIINPLRQYAITQKILVLTNIYVKSHPFETWFLNMAKQECIRFVRVILPLDWHVGVGSTCVLPLETLLAFLMPLGALWEQKWGEQQADYIPLWWALGLKVVDTKEDLAQAVRRARASGLRLHLRINLHRHSLV